MGYPGGPTVIIVLLIRGMQDKSEPEEKVMYFEDGEWGHEPTNVGGHKKLKKQGRKEIFPSEPPGSTSTPNILTLG